MSPLLLGPRYQSEATYSVTSVLFDVDNTLVGNESPDLPTVAFQAAVQNAQPGLNIGLVTARPLGKVEHILKYINATGHSILCNGAQIIDNRDNSIVVEWPINVATCKDIQAFAQSLEVTYWINDDGIDYFTTQDDLSAYEVLSDVWDRHSARVRLPSHTFTKPFVFVFHDIRESDVVKVKQFVDAHEDNNITTLIAHESLQQDGTTLDSLFVVHKKANKKDALYELAAREGLSVNQIAAVGDGRNDAVIVGEAGVGIAMGNSAQETLDVATYITGNREDNGAADALRFIAQQFSKA